MNFFEHMDAKYFLIYVTILNTNLHRGAFHVFLVGTVCDKGYQCLNIITSRVLFTLHAHFNEMGFPFNGSSCDKNISTLELTTFLQDIPQPLLSPTEEKCTTRLQNHLISNNLFSI